MASLANIRFWIIAGVCTVALILIFTTFGSSSKPQIWHRDKSLGGDIQRSDGSRSVYNETLGFEKFFVINLPSRTDHRDAISLAAHLTGLQMTYMDGVRDVEFKTLPPGSEKMRGHPGAIGAWRAHMNILRTIVEQNISTAIIAEDDIDWDIRLKLSMENFARASRLLVQDSGPSIGSNLKASKGDQQLSRRADVSDEALASVRDFDIREHDIPSATDSPYGDLENWDVLWLGHCGAKMPVGKSKQRQDRAVIHDDDTVAESQHFDPILGDRQLIQQYPNHTRVVTFANDNICSLAYAVSLPGARKLLYELSIHYNDRAADLGISSLCDGRDGRPMLNCLTVHPQLFSGHRPIARVGSTSDIGTIDEGIGKDEAVKYTKTAYTRNIRYSTRGNFDQLVYGGTNYTDWYQDGEVTPEFD